MAKNYVNGYDSPRIILTDINNVSTTYDISFKYECLKEYHEVVATTIERLNGGKSQIINFVRYSWLLSLAPYSVKGDLLILCNKVENATKQLKKITLIPHKERTDRSFVVFVNFIKAEIDMHYHHHGADNTANKGYMIEFMNAEPQEEVSVLDPDTEIPPP